MLNKFSEVRFNYCKKSDENFRFLFLTQLDSFQPSDLLLHLHTPCHLTPEVIL